MAKQKGGRYGVDGPGVPGGISFVDPGPALSRTITAASKSPSPGTWYARDLDGEIIGYSTRDEHGIIETTRRRDK